MIAGGVESMSRARFVSPKAVAATQAGCFDAETTPATRKVLRSTACRSRRWT